MNSRATVKWIGLALLGLVIAAVVAIAASNLVSQQIGIASESVSAGDSLAPALGSAKAGRGGESGREATTTTAPEQTTTTPTTPAEQTPTAPEPPTATTPTVPTEPTGPVDDSGGHGHGSGGGGGGGEGSDD